MEDQLPTYVGGQKVPKILNYIWMGPKHSLFEKGNVARTIALNPSYTVNVWIDTFSMAVPDLLEKAFHTENEKKLLRQYNAGNAAMIEAPVTEFLTVCKMLADVREVWTKYISTTAGKDAMIAKGTNVDWWLEWAKSLKNSNVTIRYLDTERYPLWKKVQPFYRFWNPKIPNKTPESPELLKETQPQRNLLNMVFLEMYVRKNYGTACDLLRCQLLIEEAGIYSDHDDKFGSLDELKLEDFRYAKVQGSITNSFLAASKGHPVLYAYRDQILNNFGRLFEVKYQIKDMEMFDAGSLKKLMVKGSDGSWWTLPRGTEEDEGEGNINTGSGSFPPFTFATLIMSGPDAFEKTLFNPMFQKFYKVKDETVKFQRGVTSGTANSWEREGAETEGAGNVGK